MLHQLTLNTKSNYLPEIFQGKDAAVITDLTVTTEAPDQWTDFVAHLAQFNQYDVIRTRSELESLLVVEDSSQRAVLHAGIARCFLGEGKLLKSIQHLGTAFHLSENAGSDAKAFIMLEMVNILNLTGNREQALIILSMCKSEVKSEYLQHIASYYENVIRARNGNYAVLDNLIISSNYFKDSGQLATLAYHYKNIGNIYGKQMLFDKAADEYDKGLDICIEHDFQHIRDAIMHDKGMLQFRRGNSASAIKTLQVTAENALSHYTRCYTSGNIGFIYFKENNFQKTEKYFRNALDIALLKGVFHLIPGTCYYIGKAAEQQKKIKEARKYYHQGAQASLELAHHKFPINGEKLKVIEESLKHPHENEIDSTENGIEFSFAINQSMKAIRATFQNAALNEILKQTGSVKDTVKKLQISNSTFSKVMNRSAQQKLKKVPDGIQHFIAQNDTLPWKKLNGEFEEQILTYLLKEYEFNKKILSKKLELNYSRLVSKMNGILDKKEKTK